MQFRWNWPVLFSDRRRCTCGNLMAHSIHVLVMSPRRELATQTAISPKRQQTSVVLLDSAHLPGSSKAGCLTPCSLVSMAPGV